MAEAIDQARQLQMEGRSDEALEMLLATAREHSDEDLRGELALFYAERGWTRSGNDALADFQESRNWADVPLARVGEARVRMRGGELEAAEAMLKEMLDLDPEEPYALLVLGEVKVAGRAFKEAGERFAHLVQLAPKFAPGYLGLARALTQLGRIKEAQGALETGMTQCPGEDELLIALAASLTETKDYDRARGAWRRAVQINRGNPDTWRGLARFSAETGDELEMHKALDQAMKLDDEGTRAWLREVSSGSPLLNAYPA